MQPKKPIWQLHTKEANEKRKIGLRKAYKEGKRKPVIMMGSSNPSWKGGQIDKKCEKCGQSYKVYPHRKKSRFCSRKCSNQVTLNNKGRRGITRLNSGYLMKYYPEHPNNSNGYILLHRLVMEKYLGRYLTREEVVHHSNKDITDNRIENLELIKNQSVHIKKEWEIGSYNNR